MSTVPCKVSDCEDPARGRGFCGFHYRRWYATGDPLAPVKRKPVPVPCSVAACPNKARTRGLCPTHYDRWRNHGSTDLPARVPDIERYWSYVDKSAGPDGCWIWTGNRTARGYGFFYAGGRKNLATRWGYRNRIGPIPSGHGILHRCDNPPCQNDLHWFTGTQADNVADMYSKGRQPRRRKQSLDNS